MTVSKDIVDAVAKCVEIVEEIDVSDCGDYVWNGEDSVWQSNADMALQEVVRVLKTHLNTLKASLPPG